MNPQPFGVVYAVSGICDHRALIGSTIDIERRWKHEHLRSLQNGKHYNKPLQAAWDTYGHQNFVLVILDTVPDERELQAREKSRIAEKKKKAAAYNVSSGAPSGMRSRCHSEETRAKMSKAQIGRGKKFRVTSPEGEVLEGEGLRDFCTTHGLNCGNMSSVLSGRLDQHKGWRRGE